MKFIWKTSKAINIKWEVFLGLYKSLKLHVVFTYQGIYLWAATLTQTFSWLSSYPFQPLKKPAGTPVPTYRSLCLLCAAQTGLCRVKFTRHRRLNKKQKENELEENQQAAKEKLNYISCTHMQSFGCWGRKCSQNRAVFILSSVSIHWLILHFVRYEPGLRPWTLLWKEEYSQKGTLKKLAAVSRQCVWPAGRRWLLQGSVWTCKIICEPALLSL